MQINCQISQTIRNGRLTHLAWVYSATLLWNSRVIGREKRRKGGTDCGFISLREG